MTRGFYTIIDMPYDGASISEHATKADAEAEHKDNLKMVDDGYYSGAALLHIEVVKEKGHWRT